MLIAVPNAVETMLGVFTDVSMDNNHLLNNVMATIIPLIGEYYFTALPPTAGIAISTGTHKHI